MPTKKKKLNRPAKTATQNPAPEIPQVFIADIYVGKNLVSAVSLKATNRTAAMLAIHKLIDVKITNEQNTTNANRR